MNIRQIRGFNSLGFNMMSSNAQRVIRLYEGNTWVSFFARIRFWTGSFVQVEKYVPEKGIILDLGCGYGILSNYLAMTSTRRKLVGVDTDRHKISFANRDLINTSFRVGDAVKMRINNLSCIIIHDVFHHLNSYDDQEKLTKSCFSMLQKNGYLIIVEVDKNPLIKLAFGRIVDFIMYKGDRVYYRFKENMENMLTKYFPIKNIKAHRLKNNPFSQVAYVCKKE